MSLVEYGADPLVAFLEAALAAFKPSSGLLFYWFPTDQLSASLRDCGSAYLCGVLLGTGRANIYCLKQRETPNPVPVLPLHHGHAGQLPVQQCADTSLESRVRLKRSSE